MESELQELKVNKCTGHARAALLRHNCNTFNQSTVLLIHFWLITGCVYISMGKFVRQRDKTWCLGVCVMSQSGQILFRSNKMTNNVADLVMLLVNLWPNGLMNEIYKCFKKFKLKISTCCYIDLRSVTQCKALFSVSIMEEVTPRELITNWQFFSKLLTTNPRWQQHTLHFNRLYEWTW